VLQELLHLKRPELKVETIAVRHEDIEFLQHVDFRRDLKELYPDLVVSFGQKYGKVEVKGLPSQVVDAEVIINERIRKICKKELTKSESQVVFPIVAKNQWNEFFSRQLNTKDITARVSLIAKVESIKDRRINIV
jgi:hypothetical protein